MNRNLIVFSTLLVVIGPSHASVRNDIERQYKRWASAAKTNDVDTVLAILAKDYTLKTYTGTVIPRDKYEASLRKRKASKTAPTEYVTKIADVKLQGKLALVTSDETSEKLSADPITEKQVKMVHIHRYLDTWVHEGRVWRLRSTVTQVERTKVFPIAKP